MQGFVYKLNEADDFSNDINELIKNKKPISLQTYNVDSIFKDKIDYILASILKLKNYQHLRAPLYFVLKEIITNANKANLKRVFFKLNNLDILNPNDYETGIIKFSEILHSNPTQLLNYLEKYKMFVKVIFQEFSGKNFTVYVINNAKINENEKKRIREKVHFFEELKNSPEESISIYDETEGAGMGLFLSLEILYKSGIPSSCFTIGPHEGSTVAKLSFDFTKVNPPPYNVVAQEILKELKTLPKYPQNIKLLLTELMDPNVDILEVSENIEKDPSLSADLLKLVNSAKYMLARKIGSIKEASNMVGIKGLKNILYSYGAMQVINERFGKISEVWDHCHKAGQIAAKLAKIYNLDKNDDEFFTAGLLHDIGKVVLMSFDKDRAEKIEDLCKKRGVDLPVMEEIMMGLSHARIGGKIAQFWEFPQSLVNAIKYHHEPIMTDSYIEIVYTIFLANYLANVKQKQDINIFMIEPEVRNFFKIYTNQKLNNLVEKLNLFG